MVSEHLLSAFISTKKNQKDVDEFLRKQGINVPADSSKVYDSMSVEELMREKENLEDIIAEREVADQQGETEPAST